MEHVKLFDYNHDYLTTTLLGLDTYLCPRITSQPFPTLYKTVVKCDSSNFSHETVLVGKSSALPIDPNLNKGRRLCPRAVAPTALHAAGFVHVVGHGAGDARDGEDLWKALRGVGRGAGVALANLPLPEK